MKLLLLSFLLLAISQSVFAQQETPPPGPEVTLHFGFYHGGPGRSIAKQLDKDGFGEEGAPLGFFSWGGKEQNPLREEGSVQLGVLFPVRQTYRAKALLLFRESDVTGNASFFEPVAHNNAVLTTAALGYVPLRSRLFRVGAGPAFHLAKGTVEYGDSELSKKSYGKLGFALEGGFSSPTKKHFYADVQVQYVYAGKGDFGTHTLTGRDFEDKPVYKKVDFSKTSFSTFTFSLGVGYKIYKEKG